ncbi:MAG TPA: thiamine pyrophosphate-dependent enzyme [Coxiellaceae bacterium]|nr:thiamine pyrophosphate-dependent enzyme [Coxiellaceae bacterium]
MATVADVLIDTLVQFGVKRVYGIPAMTVDPITDAIRRCEAIDFIVMRHEEAGALAASAQAKLNGELAVCLGCQGPGAIHLANGMYDALLDHAPILAISGEMALNQQGLHIPQQIDLVALFQPVTVYNQQLKVAETAPELIELACRQALEKRGPAHINIPYDICSAKAKKRVVVFKPQDFGCVYPRETTLNEAAEIINAGKKITIFYGFGAQDAAAEIKQLSELLKAPLVHTTRSKPFIDNHYANYIGGIGFMGTQWGNEAVEDCDVMITVGSSFGFSEFYPKEAKIVQIDLEAEKIGLHASVAVGLQGDSQETLRRLLPKLQARNDDRFLKKLQAKRDADYKKHDQDTDAQKNEREIHPQYLTHKISSLANKDAIFCLDAGTVTLWGNIFLRLNGQQKYVWSANLGTLGSGLPAGIAAQFSYPDKQVVVLTGDGGFDMLIGDFATAVLYELPIIFIIYNNGRYGFVEWEMEGQGYPTAYTNFSNCDYAALAKAFGGDGITVNKFSDIEPAFIQASKSKKPFIMDVAVTARQTYIPSKFDIGLPFRFVESVTRQFVDKFLHKRTPSGLHK